MTSGDGTPDYAAVFRETMSQFPTGVVAITGFADDAPLGLTVGSFFSVSLEPRLVGFAVARTSGTWERLRPSGRFCANMLAADQQGVSSAFARSGDADKFAGISWDRSPEGLPRITGALAWIDCAVVDEHEGGDHTIVISRVLDLTVAREHEPLIFHRRAYSTTQTIPGAAR